MKLLFYVRDEGKLQPLVLPMARTRMATIHSAKFKLFNRIYYNAPQISGDSSNFVKQVSPCTQNHGKLPKASAATWHEHYLLNKPVQV